MINEGFFSRMIAKAAVNNMPDKIKITSKSGNSIIVDKDIAKSFIDKVDKAKSKEEEDQIFQQLWNSERIPARKEVLVQLANISESNIVKKKKLINEGGFATRNQLKMYIDHFTNIDVQDYTTYEIPKPILYNDINVDPATDEYMDDEVSLSDEEVQDALDEINEEPLKEHDEQNMGNYTFDSSINLIKFEDGMRIVQGLFHSEYEDLFYKVWIEDKSTHEIVYKNDYGTEAHNEEEISDDVVDDYLDKLIQYAIDADPRLDESFDYLIESGTLLLTVDDVQKAKDGIKAPFVNSNRSTLGGEKRASILFVFSLEAKSEWKNGILENSNYAKMILSHDKSLELIAKGSREMPKFRKTKATSIEDAISKINKYIQSCSLSEEQINEISDIKKREYLDKAIDNHHIKFRSTLAPGSDKLTPKGKVKKSYLNSNEYKKGIHDLEKRRNFIQKTAKAVTGQKHYADLDGEPFNVGKIKKYSEETIQESNISMLKNMKAKSVELKFKTGDTQDVHSDEAKILLDTYNKLNDEEKKKFEDMLDKSTSSFMLAYKKAMT